MCVPWVTAIWKAESLLVLKCHMPGFRLLWSNVGSVSDSCVFDPAGETKTCASTQCFQGCVHVWTGLMPRLNAYFEVKTIREDYQCLVWSELIDLVQLCHQTHGRWLQISLIGSDAGKSSERSPQIKHGVWMSRCRSLGVTSVSMAAALEPAWAECLVGHYTSGITDFAVMVVQCNWCAGHGRRKNWGGDFQYSWENGNVLMFCSSVHLIFWMSSAGQSDPEAKCLSQMEEVYTCALHLTVSWTNLHKHIHNYPECIWGLNSQMHFD